MSDLRNHSTNGGDGQPQAMLKLDAPAATVGWCAGLACIPASSIPGLDWIFMALLAWLAAGTFIVNGLLSRYAKRDPGRQPHPFWWFWRVGAITAWPWLLFQHLRISRDSTEQRDSP